MVIMRHDQHTFMANTDYPGELRFSSLAKIAAWLSRTFSQGDRDA